MDFDYYNIPASDTATDDNIIVSTLVSAFVFVLVPAVILFALALNAFDHILPRRTAK